MTVPLDRAHRAGSAPDAEGRRKLHHEALGKRAHPGAPEVEGRTETAHPVAPTADTPDQSPMAPFIVTFRFLTTPIVRGECTLDAVLGGEIAREVASREEAIRTTPLASTGKVPHGSSLILLGDSGATWPVPALKNARRAFFAAETAAISCTRQRITQGVAKNVLSGYEAQLCEGGAWLGTGRIDEVSAILARVLAIGKRRSAGWGMLDPESLEVEPVDADPATWGLVTGPRDGDFATGRIAPRRPLPLELFRRLGGEPHDEAIVFVRVRQPYYDCANAPVPAVVPSS